MRSTPDAVMLKLSRFLPDQKIPTFSKDTLFNVLCVTALGLLPTLFYTAYVCSPIYSALRQLEICRPILEVGGSPEDLQYSGCYQRVDRDTIHFAYPSLSKGLLMVGSMVHFPVHKGYYGKPAHHIGVSTLNGF